jgi:hypothetical protein
VTEHDDEPDDPQLKRLRAVWLALPDEEPPSRGLDALMAAARAKADELAAPPWWKRIAQMLTRPPVLALASVLVVLGGAALIWNRQDVREAAPTVRAKDTGTAPAQPTEGATGAATGAAMGSSSAGEIAPGGGENPHTPSVPEVRTPERPTGAHRFDGRPALQPPVQRPPTEHSHLQGSSVHEAPAPPPPPPRGNKPATTTTPSFETETGRVQKTDEDVAPTEPQAGDDKAAEKNDKKTTTTRGPQRVMVDQLLAQCRSAAGRGDCEAAKLIARRIAGQDATFYNDHVANDAAIQKCLAK